MALSTTERTQIFLIYGIPQSGTVRIVHQLSSLWGPSFDTYDLTAVKAALTAALDEVDLNATALTMVQGILTQYFTTIGDSSQLYVNADGGSSGVLTNERAELAYLRDKLASVIGFFCPKGGYVEECRRAYGTRGRMGKY